MINEIAKIAQLVIDLKCRDNVIAFNLHGDKFCIMYVSNWGPFKQYPSKDEYATLTKENLIKACNWLCKEYESYTTPHASKD